MWDLFNKETVKDLQATVKDLESKLSSKEREVQKLDAQLTKQISRNAVFTEQSEKRQKALDAVLDELRAFLIQNKEKNLHYDSLAVTKELIDDFADVKEYVFELDVRIFIGRNTIDARDLQNRLKKFLKEFESIESFRYRKDLPLYVSIRREVYSAVIEIFTYDSIDVLENVIYNFLYAIGVTIKEQGFKNGEKFTIQGSLRR